MRYNYRGRESGQGEGGVKLGYPGPNKTGAPNFHQLFCVTIFRGVGRVVVRFSSASYLIVKEKGKGRGRGKGKGLGTPLVLVWI